MNATQRRPQGWNRHRLVAATVAAVAAVLPVLVLADSDPASAAEWWEDVAQAAVDTCMEMPETLLGFGTAAPGIPKVAADGTVTFSQGSSLATRVVQGGAKAGFWAAVAAGSFCGGMHLASWLFPQYSWVGETPSEVEVVAVEPCPPGTPGVIATDVCMTVQAVDGVPFPPAMYWRAVRWSDAGHFVLFMPVITPDGEVAGQVYGNGSTTQVVPVRCPDDECGAFGLSTPWSAERHRVGVRLNGSCQNCARPFAPMHSDDFLRQGNKVRVFARNVCMLADGTEEVREYSSPVGRAADGEIEWESPKCAEGEIPTQVLRKAQAWTCLAGSWSNVTCDWVDDPAGPLLNWTMPAAVKANHVTRQCWVVGLTVCPTFDPDPSDPDGDVEVGGAGGLRVPKGTPGSRTKTAPEIMAELPWPENDPREQPAPSTTTSTTTTSPTTTIAPPEDPENCEGVHCAGGPGVPPPESEGSECWPSGWGWLNPVEWVLRPIKCALMWAFWDQDSADEMAALGSEHGWTQAVTGSSVNTDPAAGPCLQLDHGAEICTEPILSYEVPSVVEGLVAAVVLFFGLFEVIGLFARITGG